MPENQDGTASGQTGAGDNATPKPLDLDSLSVLGELSSDDTTQEEDESQESEEQTGAGDQEDAGDDPEGDAGEPEGDEPEEDEDSDEDEDLESLSESDLRTRSKQMLKGVQKLKRQNADLQAQFTEQGAVLRQIAPVINDLASKERAPRALDHLIRETMAETGLSREALLGEASPAPGPSLPEIDPEELAGKEPELWAYIKHLQARLDEVAKPAIPSEDADILKQLKSEREAQRQAAERKEKVQAEHKKVAARIADDAAGFQVSLAMAEKASEAFPTIPLEAAIAAYYRKAIAKHVASKAHGHKPKGMTMGTRVDRTERTSRNPDDLTIADELAAL